MTDFLEGVEVLINSLKTQGTKYIFGIVGIPVAEVAICAQQNGIKYIGMRNEQAACYAAQAMGYLTGSPGVCLVVSGPGLLHTIGGIANAKENCWPLIVLGGSSDRDQEGKGAFQECPQVDACRLFCKSSVRPSSVESLPYIIHQAFKNALFGRPGPVYIDLPGDLLRSQINSESLVEMDGLKSPAVCIPQSSELENAINELRNAEKPLIVIGKGSAYSRAEEEIRRFVSLTTIPFLPMPMGKGVVPDDDSMCISAARSLALREADVILLLGARLNWMTHFGMSPRFNKNVKFIQVDICPEEFHTCVQGSVSLFGDIRCVVNEMNKRIQVPFKRKDNWINLLGEKIKSNQQVSIEMCNDTSVPLNYYAAFTAIKSQLPKDCIIVSEGANTMDIGRAFLLNSNARQRLDAGSFGTMGVGLGFGIAAALHAKDEGKGQRVVCVEGDSAFGFSGMEIETMYRYELPVIIIIINNNGIYGGLNAELFDEIKSYGDLGLTLPPTALKPGIRYEKISSMFLDEGYFCQTVEEVKTAVSKALTVDNKPTVINVEINPSAIRKAQDFDWLTRSKL